MYSFSSLARANRRSIQDLIIKSVLVDFAVQVAGVGFAVGLVLLGQVLLLTLAVVTALAVVAFGLVGVGHGTTSKVPFNHTT